MSSARAGFPEGEYGKEFLSSLRAAGLVVRSVPTGEARAIKGTAVIATISAESGLRQSVEDPGIFSFADGY